MDNTLVKIESKQVQTSLMVTGWELPSTMTETDWKQAGSFLMQVNQARQWWLGDWWNACKWGDGEAACKEIGVSYQTAQDCGWVAASFQISRRREKLTFSHHRETCPIENQTIQDQLLEWCLSDKKRKQKSACFCKSTLLQRFTKTLRKRCRLCMHATYRRRKHVFRKHRKIFGHRTAFNSSKPTG